MIEISGDLWDYHGKPDCICCIPTNGVVTCDGRNIMGAGLAKDANHRLSTETRKLDRLVGSLVDKGGNHVYLVEFPGCRIFTFPTKDHFRNMSSRSLICRSCRELVQLLPSGTKAVLPRPGCGLGGLDWVLVKSSMEPILVGDDFVVVSPERKHFD